MKRAWRISAKVLTGFFVAAMYAMPQAYTISAKPGVVNYIEGSVYLNGRPISVQDLKASFLNANDVVSTDLGKAEVLLTPGVFLRLGANTQVRMVSLSLTDPQVEIKAGEAMIEVDDLVKDNDISVLDGGGSVSITKSGLYRFTAGESPSVAVLEGKAEIHLGDRKTELGKGHEALLADSGKSQKFNTKQEDDLYAWSNVRSEYDAASSYQAAKNVSLNNYGGGGWGDFGFAGAYSPGWFWNSGFNSWAWLPGNNAFYSPFGYGFYGPGVVGYAPVVYAPVYGGGGWYRGQPVSTQKQLRAAVPVNPQSPPAIGKVTASPFANQAARSQAVRAFSATGFNTANGMHVPAGRAAFSGGSAGRGSSGGHVSSSSGSFSGGHSGGSFGGMSSGGMSGGSHSSGSGGGGGHH